MGINLRFSKGGIEFFFFFFRETRCQQVFGWNRNNLIWNAWEIFYSGSLTTILNNWPAGWVCWEKYSWDIWYYTNYYCTLWSDYFPKRLCFKNYSALKIFFPDKGRCKRYICVLHIQFYILLLVIHLVYYYYTTEL